ncbi:ABC transporter ATP-binding protein [cyanobacterium endosymbiont of Epithemia turgida]|uniref:ABC transporter ATP-binding protein n=1 Tax=cyanobacterium endosymbiont of Epithemia turgida TaxID=718217 RepID=UPI0004D15734|nr:ABC transporter ATP-binding protein [cyanobacterium endosymbiont of Epithemia turgida]BAP18255.1 ABC transporter ATP-binding protein [cyanobacterium endosymbiont of Epithemia turgida isolate EtSB Lake Yunoko]
MSDTILNVCNLRVEFPQEKKSDPVVAVNEISFQLKRGEILGIVGESGSGKSITSLAIMGLIPIPGQITKGEINFYSAETPEKLSELKRDAKKWQDYRGRKIAMIFQEPMSSFNPVYTIGYQLIEAIQLHQKYITNQQAKNQAITLFQKVQVFPSDERLEQKYLTNIFPEKKNISGPVSKEIKNYVNQEKEAFLRRYPHELSGGQLQRVMIAMAISCNPTLLIADEPTTALDVTVQAEILRLLKDLCKSEEHQDMSMIFISHDLGVINKIADKVIVMYQGKIVEQGYKDQIFYHPRHEYTKGLLACRPRLEPQLDRLPTVGDFLRSYKTDSQEDNQLKKIKYRIISPEDKQQRLVTLLQKNEPLLRVNNLTVEFSKSGFLKRKKDNFKAVNDISFEVYPGETLGLVGESGCGKSTVARTILRLIPTTKGQIYFKKHPIHKYSSNSKLLRHLRREMQIIFQNPYNSLNPRLTIGQAIGEPMVIHKTGGNTNQRKERVAYLLNKVGLDANLRNRYPHEFSGGQRQRICIARALALNPQFIICDESVSALDVSVQAQVLNLLKDLQDELQLTYIFISHDLSVVRFMSDRIMVMNQGKIEELASADTIVNSPTKEYTRKLINSIPHFPEEPFLLGN